jgi:multiple sugar transport system substrate-binding protein
MKKRPLTMAMTAVAGAAAILAAGCGSSGGSGNSGNQKAITYALWDPNEAVGYKTCIANFEKANPDITVNMQIVPYASYWTKLYTEASAGNAPDVFWDMPEFEAGLAAKGALLDESPYIKKAGLQVSAFNIPQLVNDYTIGGKTYGVQKDWDSLGYFYNMSLLKKAGVSSVPKLTWNPQDGGTFLSLMQKLTLDRNGKHAGQPGFDPAKIVQYGFAYFDSSPAAGDSEPWIYSNGGYVLKSGQLGIGHPQTQAAVQFMNDLINKWHVAPPYSAIQSATPFALFTGQRVAVWQSGPWELSGIEKSGGFPVGIGMTATGPNGSWTRSNGLEDNIAAKTSYPGQAWKWVQYIASPACQDVLGSSGVVFPATQNGTKLFQQHWMAKGINVQAFIDAAHNNGDRIVTDPVVVDGPQFQTNWLNTISTIYQGQSSVSGGLAKLQTEEQQLAGA